MALVCVELLKEITMASYRIITDSSCDLTQELADELGLAIAPLSVNFKGEERKYYLDGRELNVKAFYQGLREGEMMALLPGDFDFEKKTISVTKTYHRSKGEDVFTDPKTPKSNGIVTMPDFLAEELKYYMSMLYDLQKDSRVFPVTKNYLYQRMDKGCKEQGLTRIRVHDLRHSHVSLLINMGYSAVAIADRMGHESIDITYRYAHLFPTVQKDMASDLNKQMEVAV